MSKSMLPATPPSICDAFGVLLIVTRLMSSEGYWLNSMVRRRLGETCSRPFIVANTNSSPKPRIWMSEAWPPERVVVRPATRERLSAIEKSGRPPMSSAVMTSTMESASRLARMEFSSERR